ncbi:MAG: 5'-methylthioadenosine/S-adenosylhomocysteine nucleosidase [Spirochaetota bacterium]|nr:MAG: 5'-methylthioadenosine/S-adenosylhomocysteine nucleosidase [Spirochaetota bacterium]
MNREICILVSYLKEILPFIDHLSDLNTERKGKFIFYKGTLAEKRVLVIQTLIKEGKTISSLIKGASLVISTGICGALVPYLHTGDIIIAEKVFLYKKTDSDKIANKSENQAFQSLKIPAASRVYERLKKKYEDKQFSIDKGLTVTSDFVLQNTDRKIAVNKKTSALSVDMEDFHRLSIAKELGIPFLSIRAVFDELHEEILPCKGVIHPSFKEKLIGTTKNLAIAVKAIILSS